MKHLLTSLLFISISVMASDSKSVFYEPSKSNAYQGRLFYDANQEDYPIDKMMERCKGFTGVATAQTKSKKKPILTGNMSVQMQLALVNQKIRMKK